MGSPVKGFLLSFFGVSDPEHGDRTGAGAVEACDLHARAALGTPEGALDPGSGRRRASEREHGRVSLRSLRSVSDLLIDCLQFSGAVCRGDLASGDAGEQGSAEGVGVGDLDRLRGTVACEHIDRESDQAVGVLVCGEGGGGSGEVQDEEVSHGVNSLAWGLEGSLSPSHSCNVTR